MAGDFPDGVYFVPLVALRESELVLPAIATTYGIQEGEDLRGRLIGAIGSKRQLIVLDNFEQLLSAGSEIGGLLGETPRLKLLVTSRSLLGVYGEREYDVPTLSLPDPDRLPRVDELARSEAVALFVDEVRVDMLETLREFALERLRARGELDEYRERHAMAYAEWAESAVLHLSGEEGGRWLDRMEREHNNLRAALTRTAERATVDLAMRLVSASWRFWQMRGHIFEGRDRAETSCSSRTA